MVTNGSWKKALLRPEQNLVQLKMELVFMSLQGEEAHAEYPRWYFSAAETCYQLPDIRRFVGLEKHL